MTTLDRILETGVIAVVRLGERLDLLAATQALAAGGVNAVEITLTTPGALETIAALVAACGEHGCIVGAGTVLDAASAQSAIDAGAHFIVSPTFDADVIGVCRDHDIICVPGAFTPTEILEAHRAGAALVKVFPSSAIGSRYLRDLLTPMPFLRLVPSGGVTIANAPEWIAAGAAAVSVGSALVNVVSVKQGQTGGLTSSARAFVDAVAAGRRLRT
ncbi:MAG TPA: bifunctional 4-hydroxy-2-oxoglutarate aldolase/2-dehydro-3-deoxy-phosphogluconate aldolase [Gemmatimonadaceae bacterium]|nr:bifunctional 4-hydroxy-2-oxoglutarate aldolase/2-dehydro-3-deoxy-phosphogluconate aldolase [Gemmatimonadaceae bacterium]